MGQLSPGGSVAIGVIVGLLSTSIQSVGLTLQRKSHLLEDEKEEHLVRRPPYRRRRWQLGMLMFIIANLVGSTIQITTLPLPVLSTLQASGLVFNSICATLILSEAFTRYSLIGTILVASGAILIATFGALAEPSHTLDQLLELLGRRQFAIWMAMTFVAAALIIVGAFVVQRLLHPHRRNSSRVRLLRGMAYGCISGILSAHSLLVAKSAVELLVRTIVDRHNQFNRWQSWLILLSLAFLALTQLYFLHRGLKLCSTSVLYPFVFCIYNIIAILDGLIYFRQTSRLPISHALLIAVGTVILLLGVFALSWRLDDHDASGAKTGVPQTALTPGMGLVDDTTDDEEDETEFGSIDHHSTDEEAAAPSTSESALDPFPPLLLHPTTADSHRSSASFHTARSWKRRETLQEADEIWDELRDSPTLNGDRRASRVVTFTDAEPDADGADESTALLRGQRRRRRSSRLSSASGRGSVHRRGNTILPQGWFRMRWWKRRKEDDGEGDSGAGTGHISAST
ncbi:magnesium transporter NIPA-domain-containing protein [Cryomyces antarcticus]